jgi:hypothetical protein
MIRSLDDVERYSRELARTLPRIADSVEFRRPGLSELEVARLRRQLPGLPDEYLEIAKTWDLVPLSIGYFNLCPPSFGKARQFVDRLTVANSPTNPAFDALKTFQMLMVATYEGDPLAIGTKHTPRANHVFRLAPSVDNPPRPRLVARSFGDLLKAATELDVYRASGRTDPGTTKTFLRTIADYIPHMAASEWETFAAEALQPR